MQDAMTHNVTTVRVDTTIKHATELLADNHISTLPVLDASGRLAGVVSEADLIRDAFPPDPRAHLRVTETVGRAPSHVVSEVMTPHVYTAYASTDLADAVELMTSTGIKCLPVVDDHGVLVGVISRSDLIRVRAKADEVIEREVDNAMVSLGHTDWLVEVHEGMVDIEGPATELDRTLARVGASTIPGVVGVTVR